MKKFLRYCLLKISTLRWSGIGILLLATLSATSNVTRAADVPQPPLLVTKLCAACHGLEGISVAPMFPNLAGQYESYLTKQLNDFIDGRRKNAIMSPNVATLTSQDVAALAAYYSSQKPTPGHPGDPKLIATGKAFYVDGNPDSGVPGCVGCHMDEGVGTKTYPRLAGQNAAYIVQQLTNFRAGIRKNDRGSLMRAVTAQITDDEIKAVAEYLASIGP